MDLQLGIDLFDSDSDDQVQTSKTGDEKNKYVAKVEKPMWFLRIDSETTNESNFGSKQQEVIIEEDEEAHLRRLKSKADFLYYQKQYKAAIKLFEELLGCIPASNKGFRRQIWDSLARGFNRIGNYGKALEFGEYLILPPHADDVVSWLLLADTHDKMADHTEEMLLCRHKVVQLRSCNPTYWMNLFYGYVKSAKRPFQAKCFICSFPKVTTAAMETIQGQFSKLFRTSDWFTDNHLCDVVMVCCLLWTQHILISTLRTLDWESEPELHCNMEDVQKQINLYPNQKLLGEIQETLSLLKPLVD